MNKNFNGWMTLKNSIHNSGSRPGYKTREVWWVSIGRNVGFEEDGKGKFYNRPVLILRGFSKEFFLGIPLSHTSNRGKYYHDFIMNGKVSVALLSQMRAFDTLRLISKCGMISIQDFNNIKKKCITIINDEPINKKS